MTTERDRPLLGFYGDDFTGSTDAMGVTALAGLKTVLFTRLPDDEALARFAGYDAIGIAGTSRARSPNWMDEHLPQVFRTLSGLGPRIVHYKVCSTFDSAPETGSIGRAIDIGTKIVGGHWSPVIVGTPQLGRWQAFGNLFAAAGGQNFRIDRHPTMSRHPVTPMGEADLRLHLAHQTARPVLGVDFPALDEFSPGALPDGCPAVFLDVVDPASQERAGQIVWDASADQQIFSAASSGLQYALVAHWRRIGLIPSEAPPLPQPAPVSRLLVLSGSCSPATAEQIDDAERNGFVTIQLDVVAATDPDRAAAELDRVINACAAAFDQTRAVVVYAARTVDDPAYRALERASAERGIPFAQTQDALGKALGRIALDAVPRFGLSRLVVAGGDTSGRIIETLPIDALEVAHAFVKGAPICRCHAGDIGYDGLQVVLKGGQMGDRDVFSKALGPA